MYFINQPRNRPAFRWGLLSLTPDMQGLFFPEYPGLPRAYVAYVERLTSGAFYWQLSGFRFEFQDESPEMRKGGIEPNRRFALEAAEKAAEPMIKEFDAFITSPAGVAYLTAVAPKITNP